MTRAVWRGSHLKTVIPLEERKMERSGRVERMDLVVEVMSLCIDLVRGVCVCVCVK